MQKKLFISELAGFALCCVIGTLAHFFYEWSGGLFIVGLFCPVNESVWEHLKLVFFPYLIFSVAQLIAFKGRLTRFFMSKTLGVSAGMFLILVIHYTYSGAIGGSSTAADIASFYAAVGAAFFVSHTVLRNSRRGKAGEELAAAVYLFFLCAVFFVFTAAPPLIPLFRDPVTGTYGI